MDKFDNFFACICNPLHSLEVADLFRELEEVERAAREASKGKHSLMSINYDGSGKPIMPNGRSSTLHCDKVPYNLFIDYISSSEVWQMSNLQKH